MRSHALPGPLLALGLLTCLVGPAPADAAFVPICVIQAPQPFTPPETNFEVVLSGKQPNQVSSPFINGFSAPSRISVTGNASAGTTTVAFSGPSISTTTSKLAFGFGLPNGGSTSYTTGVSDVYWTMGQTIEGHLAPPTISISYSPTPQLAMITYTNDPSGNITLTNAGYYLTATAFTASDLAGPTLSGTFHSLTSSTTLTPGNSVSFTVHGVAPGEFVTVVTDASYTDPGTGITSVDTLRTEYQTPTPEPSSLALAFVGAIGLAAAGASRMSRPRPVQRPSDDSQDHFRYD